jgi:predicted lipid carrier protein YhbT
VELGLRVRNLLDQLPWESLPRPLGMALEASARLARAVRDARAGEGARPD